MSAEDNYIEVIGELEQGCAHAEISELLRETIKGVIENQKKGDITVKLNIKPAENADDRVWIKLESLKATIPEPARPPSHYYASTDGTVSREDPSQGILPGLARVDNEPTKLRTVGAEDGTD